MLLINKMPLFRRIPNNFIYLHRIHGCEHKNIIVTLRIPHVKLHATSYGE